ncbi:hypothetical protein U1Q18_017986, partial [Sarracenia purpurea var. burkii]
MASTREKDFYGLWGVPESGTLGDVVVDRGFNSMVIEIRILGILGILGILEIFYFLGPMGFSAISAAGVYCQRSEDWGSSQGDVLALEPATDVD